MHYFNDDALPQRRPHTDAAACLVFVSMQSIRCHLRKCIAATELWPLQMSSVITAFFGLQQHVCVFKWPVLLCDHLEALHQIVQCVKLLVCHCASFSLARSPFGCGVSLLRWLYLLWLALTLTKCPPYAFCLCMLLCSCVYEWNMTSGLVGTLLSVWECDEYLHKRLLIHQKLLTYKRCRIRFKNFGQAF